MRGALPLLALALAAGPLAAQGDSVPAVAPVDRIIAVVGEKVILKSELEEAFFQAVSQGSLPPMKTAADSARAKREFLANMVDEELLVQQAQKDTAIKVTDQEVADGVDSRVREVRSKFTTELDFTRELKGAGFTSLDEYRRFLQRETSRDLYKTRLLDKLRGEQKLKPLQPTEPEMRAFFEEHRGEFGKRPETIGFRQVVIAPRPAEPARARARALADSILAELRKGADFATAAKRFSADPGSRDQGGDLGWARRGLFVPEFERVAFALRPGVISEPVESPFGFHLIQVLRTQPGEVQVRHILLAPEITDADVDSARALAQRVRDALAAGAPIDSLQRLYHDPTEEREAPDAPIAKLPPVYGRVLGSAKAGDIVGPFDLAGAGGRSKVAVLRVTERRGEGDIRYEDVRDRVKQILGEQLGQRKYLDRLRRATFVEVRAP